MLLVVTGCWTGNHWCSPSPHSYRVRPFCNWPSYCRYSAHSPYQGNFHGTREQFSRGGVRPDPIVTNLLNENNCSDKKKTRPIPGLCCYTSHGKKTCWDRCRKCTALRWFPKSKWDLYISSEEAGSGNRSYAELWCPTCPKNYGKNVGNNFSRDRLIASRVSMSFSVDETLLPG